MKLHEHIKRLRNYADFLKELHGRKAAYANDITIVLSELNKRLTPCRHCTEGMQEVHKETCNELTITDKLCEVCNGDYLEGGEDGI
jgi:cytidine deaminase